MPVVNRQKNILSNFLSWFLIFWIFIPFQSTAEERDIKTLSWVSKSTIDGAFFINIFEVKKIQKIDFSDLDISSEKLDKTDPLDTIFFNELNEVNLRKYLLKSGFAKLRKEELANNDDIEAQHYAQRHKVGLWSNMTDKPPIKDKEPPSKKDKSPEKFYWQVFGENVLQFTREWGGIGAFIASLYGLWKGIQFYHKRRKLTLLFLGARSSGKSTLFKRLFTPNEKPRECNSPETTPKTAATTDKTKPWGRYEVTPIYVDTAGGAPHEQMTEMLRHDNFLTKLIRPNRYVWIIMLATTEKRVTMKDLEEKKIDSGFISEQLGYLALPIAMLQMVNIPKPDMIVICLSKFDLFSEHEPFHTASAEAKKLFENLFAEHTKRIKSATGKNIPVVVESCSACEDWRVKNIKDAIEEKLFTD